LHFREIFYASGENDCITGMCHCMTDAIALPAEKRRCRDAVDLF